jgi:hypothetical protein
MGSTRGSLVVCSGYSTSLPTTSAREGNPNGGKPAGSANERVPDGCALGAACEGNPKARRIGRNRTPFLSGSWPVPWASGLKSRSYTVSRAQDTVPL